MQNTEIETLKEAIKRHYPELWPHTEACLATTATLLLKNNVNPTALVLVGQSSSGKTTVLNFFKTIPNLAYPCDNFTKNAWLTQYANKDKAKLEDVDLLKRICKKLFIVFDLGMIFSKRRDELAQCLAVLTRVLDGDGLTTDAGVHGQRSLTGDYLFSMIAGTTPLKYRVWETSATLGSRLLFMNVSDTAMDDEAIMQSFSSTVSIPERTAACSEATKIFVTNLFEKSGGFRGIAWDEENKPREVMSLILALAKLLGRLRGIIPNVYEDNGDIQYQQPRIESPLRAMSLLLNLAKGRAIIYGRNQISMEDVPMLLEIVLSSCPLERSKIVWELFQKADHKLTTSEVCKLLNVGEKNALKIMANLEILKLANQSELDSTHPGRPGYALTISEDVLKAIQSIVRQ
jgi:energy-coupling factor transporter ATP-binding protein EcfA2